MPLTDTATLVRRAREGGYAVVQFNTNGATYDLTRAVVEAADEAGAPIILGAYEANLGYRGYAYAAMQMRHFAQQAKVPVAVHLDHGTTPDACRQAIEHDFTSVMIDGSKMPLDENIAQTQQVVELAKPRGVSVEAEIGELQTLNPDGSMNEVRNLSDPEQARRISHECDIDMLAVGIGNAHGFYKDAPDIRFDLLEKLAEASRVPLVLHGSTGLDDDVIRRCVSMGMAKINLGTLLRTRCVEFTADALAEGKDAHKNHPWRVGQAVKDKLKPLVRHALDVSGSTGQAGA